MAEKYIILALSLKQAAISEKFGLESPNNFPNDLHSSDDLESEGLHFRYKEDRFPKVI